MKGLSKFVQRLLMGITVSLMTVNYTASNTFAQDLETVFSGQNIPLTLQLKDLDNNWRKISVNGQFEMGDFMATWTGFLDGLLNTKSHNNVYFSQGKTITIGNNNYMIAYRIPMESQSLDLQTLFSLGKGNNTCDEGNLPFRLTPNTEVSLALLNLNTAGSFNDIMSLNIKQEIADSESKYSAAKLLCEKAFIDESNQKALKTIKTINTVQEDSYYDMSKFVNSLDNIGLDLSAEKEHFNIIMEVEKDRVFTFAIPKNKDLNSYVGAIFYSPEINYTKTIICQSEKPTTKKLAKPIIKNQEITCPPNTILVE